MKKFLFLIFVLVMICLSILFVSVDNNHMLSHYEKMKIKYEVKIPVPDYVIYYQEKFYFSDYTKYSVYEYADDNKKKELLKLEWRYIEEEKKVLLNEIFMNELNLEKNIPRIDEKCLYYYETANNGRDRLHILWPYNSNFIYIIDENF